MDAEASMCTPPPEHVLVADLGQHVIGAGLIGRSVLLGGGGGLQFHAAHIPGGGGAPSFARLYPHLDIQLGYAF